MSGRRGLYCPICDARQNQAGYDKALNAFERQVEERTANLERARRAAHSLVFAILEYTGPLRLPFTTAAPNDQVIHSTDFPDGSVGLEASRKGRSRLNAAEYPHLEIVLSRAADDAHGRSPYGMIFDGIVNRLGEPVELPETRKLDLANERLRIDVGWLLDMVRGIER